MATTQAGPDVGWLKGAATDERGNYDAAYISLLVLAAMVALTTLYSLVMIALAWHTGKAYDPLPLGGAVAAVCGGFATALGALAGYMAATRPHRDPDRDTNG